MWLLNNDTEVQPDSLTRLVERAQEDDSIGIVGSTLLYHHNRRRVQALGGARYNRWLGVAKHIGEGQNWDKIKDNIRRDEIERQMDYVVGASMLVSRRFIEAVGLMSEDYSLYFEELDWAIRGKKKGFRLAWAPDSIVYHKEGATTGGGPDPGNGAFSRTTGILGTGFILHTNFTHTRYPQYTSGFWEPSSTGFAVGSLTCGDDYRNYMSRV